MMLAVLLGVLVIGLLLLAVVSGGVKPAKVTKTRRTHLDPKLVHARWTTILDLSSQGGAGLRQSIMEADKLLDYVLKGKGFAGETMADRLRSAGPKLSRRNAVWSAHKLRNVFAHEVDADVVASQVKDALKNYERAIRDLGGGL